MHPVFMYVVWSTVALAALMSTIFLLRLLLSIGPFIHRLQAVLDTLESLGDTVSSAAKPLVEDVEDLSRAARHAHAAIAAVRTGLDTFFFHRRAGLSEPDPPVSPNQES